MVDGVGPLEVWAGRLKGVNLAHPLFRAEAIDAQRQQWLGSVQLVRPLALSWLAAGALMAALGLACFLGLASYTRKASVSGMLVPDRGLIRLVPSVSGTVIDRRVTEGQSVLAGELLFVVALDQHVLSSAAQSEVSRALAEREQSLSRAVDSEQALEQVRLARLDRRLASLSSELAQFDSEFALKQQSLALAEQSQTRLQSLEAEHFISAAQIQAKSEDVLAIRAVLQSLARQRASLLRERDTVLAERRMLPLQTQSAVASLEHDLAQARRDAAEQGAQQRILVRAPATGVVSTVLATPGQSVSPSAALATLVPQGAHLQAQLYAPSASIGFVQPGQAVRLRYEAFPYQKYGLQPGHVLQVSRTPLAANEWASLGLPAAAASDAEPLFRITVALDGPPSADMPLAVGMRLQADIVLERRRLIEWLFEPVLGWRNRL